MLGSAVEESYTQYVYVNGVRHHNGIAGFRARGGMEVWLLGLAVVLPFLACFAETAQTAGEQTSCGQNT